MPPDDFFPKLRKYCDEKKILLMADEVLTSWGRTGKWLCMEHWGVVPDVVSIGKGFGNGFPVTCVAVREPYKESFEKISASSSYGGNPMACAAALASTEVIEEENLLEHALHLGEIAQKRMERMKAEHPIVGDVRAKGCLMGIELVKDRTTKTPFDKAGELVYQKAFRKGLAWIPAGHILRMSPPIVMDDDDAAEGPGHHRRGHRRSRKGTGMLSDHENHPFWNHRLRADGPRVCQRRGPLVPFAGDGRAAGDRGRLRSERRRAAMVYRQFSVDPAGDAAIIAPCWTIRRSTRSIAPCRTICTRRSTARPSRPANT